MTIRKLFCALLSLIMLLSICAGASAMTAGTYEGVGTGRSGDVKVSANR